MDEEQVVTSNEQDEKLEQAKKLSKAGGWVAFFSAGATFLVVVNAMYSGADVRENPYADPLNLIDVGFLVLCGIGMLRYSRTAAILGFLFFLFTKIFLALSQDQYAGLFVGIVFLAVFGGAIKGSFTYHKVMKERDPGYRGSPLWLRYVGMALGAGVVALVIFAVLSETPWVAPLDVVEGSDLAQNHVDELRTANVLGPSEKVKYFYTYGMVSVLLGGSIITDEAVITYYTDEFDDVIAYRLPIDELTSVEFLAEESDWVDQVYQVNGLDGDWITVVLPTEAEGGVEFVNAIEARITR